MSVCSVIIALSKIISCNTIDSGVPLIVPAADKSVVLKHTGYKSLTSRAHTSLDGCRLPCWNVLLAFFFKGNFYIDKH